MAELSVSKKSIKNFLSIKEAKFIIPDYQREYSWDEEKCDILWEDITNFSKEKEEEYFLGTIVICGNKEKIEVIDGQQRITSLFLLLRAFYKKLEEMKEDDNIKGLKLQIEPCIWKIDRISGKVTDKKKIHIVSQVVTAQDNEVFHRILAEGGLDNNKSKYQKNYNFFYEQCKKFAEKEPTQWQGLLVDILEKCIVLPIDCDDFDSALTIFSTLNDRGLPLADSDIFKSQIYKKESDKEKRKKFIDSWKELTEKTKNAKIKLDNLFTYYMRYLGGQKKNTRKDVEVSLRKFYAKNNYEKLKDPDLMGDLETLATFWVAINRRDLDFKNEKISLEAYKYLHCLHYYPNEYWRYITSVFYLKKKEDSNFKEDFPKFLKRLTAS